MYDSPRGQEVVFFLCCSSDECDHFTVQIRELMLHNDVRSVTDPRRLVSEIKNLPADKGAVLVVLAVGVERAWEGYEALKTSGLQIVPAVAICAEGGAEAAYARGVDAVLRQEQWRAEFMDTVVHLTSFWVRLVRRPRPEAGRRVGGRTIQPG